VHAEERTPRMPDPLPLPAFTAAGAPGRWMPAPAHPQLRPDEVHVWRADITEAGEGAEELLSPDERARAERILSEERRRAWTRAHGILRQLLGRYLGCDPRALRFSGGADGKPELLGDELPAAGSPAGAASATAPLSFNISHSGHLVLYAFSAEQPVGVDVEIAGRPRDEVRLAARAFGPAAAQRLADMDPATRAREFRRAWVRYEAALKCRGTGIGHPAGVSAGPDPWIAELLPGQQAVAAVAAERPPRELRCWTVC